MDFSKWPKLVPFPGALTSEAEGKQLNWHKEHQAIIMNLAVYIHNHDPFFLMLSQLPSLPFSLIPSHPSKEDNHDDGSEVRHDGTWDRDGCVVKKLEGVPLIGYVVAAVQAIAGNPQYAARALAKCTNSTVVLVGYVIGFALGATFGSVIGAGLFTPIGIYFETEIKERLIDDPVLLAQFEEATQARYITETLLNMGLALLPGGDSIGKMMAGKAFGPMVKNYARQVVANLRSSVAPSVVEEKVKTVLLLVRDLLDGNLPPSLVEAEEKAKKVLQDQDFQLMHIPPMLKFHIN